MLKNFSLMYSYLLGITYFFLFNYGISVFSSYYLFTQHYSSWYDVLGQYAQGLIILNVCHAYLIFMAGFAACVTKDKQQLADLSEITAWKYSNFIFFMAFLIALAKNIS